jgi:hypothetical protein
MRFVPIATAFIFATLAQAFIIPEGTAEGVYAVFTADDGTEVHTKIAKRDPTGMTPIKEVHTLRRRQNDRIWCGCGFNMDPGNCDAAVQALKDQLSEQSLLADM